MNNDIQANPELVAKASDDIEAFLEKYFTENKLDLATCFMAIHNGHKRMVVKIARLWSINGVAEKQTYRMSDMTWRKAMRALWRD